MTQVREEVTLTDGRVIVRGQLTARGKKKRADYILYHKPNLPIAVIEAKENNHSVGDGMQQALEYAEMLDLTFAYSSNGDGFIEHDRSVTDGQIEREISLDSFPTPQQALATLLRLERYSSRRTWNNYSRLLLRWNW